MKSMIRKYDIQKKDTYNINKKEFTFNIANKGKIIYVEYNIQIYKI